MAIHHYTVESLGEGTAGAQLYQDGKPLVISNIDSDRAEDHVALLNRIAHALRMEDLRDMEVERAVEGIEARAGREVRS